MKSDLAPLDSNRPYSVIIDIVGFLPSYRAPKKKIAAALTALRISLKEHGILTENGKNSSSKEQKESSPLIIFHLNDNLLIAMTKDGKNATLVHLLGSLMNIELTLMSAGIPIRGIVFQETEDPNESSTWMTCSIDGATKLCESLRAFGIFGITKLTDNSLTQKRTKSDIPLEYPTLVPTTNGLMRLSMINWCCFFRDFTDVVAILNNISPAKQTAEYFSFFTSTQEIVKDAYNETWKYDDNDISLPLPFNNN